MVVVHRCREVLGVVQETAYAFWIDWGRLLRGGMEMSREVSLQQEVKRDRLLEVCPLETDPTASSHPNRAWRLGFEHSPVVSFPLLLASSAWRAC
jgi:hypothetical protein